MDKSVLVQKQVRDNSEDLQSEFLDMKNWEEQMKRKDEELKKEASGEIVLPPVRSKGKKKVRVPETKRNGNSENPKRIKSYDYSSWEKFDVEKACKELEKEEKEDESDGETMSKEELQKAHAIAVKHKNEGNVLVQKQEWVKAIACYNEAIKAFPYDAVFYANRALCQLKLDNLHSAESDCSATLQLDETYVKAYHRRATARFGLKQYKEAKQDLDKLLKLEPSNKEATLLLSQVKKKLESSKPVIISGEDLGNEPSIEKRIAEKLCLNTKTTSEAKSEMKEELKEKTRGDTEISTKKQRDLRIPDWLPEKDDVSVVESVDKPAHLRSKKPGIRIPVEEISFEAVNRSSENNLHNKNESVKPIAAVENNSNKQEDKGDVKKVSEVECEIPTVPKTAVQFLMHWRRNKSADYRYKYLKQLSPGSLPTIFQDSLESDIFSEILEILRTEFATRQEPVFQYLEDLSKVKRFKALIMFISNKDKEGLRSLFDYCKTDENISDEKIHSLSEWYEI